jgi:hypothetical protein
VRQDPLLVRSHLSILHLPSPLAELTWQVLLVIHQVRIGQFVLADKGWYLPLVTYLHVQQPIEALSVEAHA